MGVHLSQRSASSGGFWNTAVGQADRRPCLDDDIEADVCIVGGGYTGLWTAWALLNDVPDIKVVIVEARYVGFGASGRNGGWLSGLMPGNREVLAGGPAGRPGVLALQRQLITSVHDVVRICAEEGIEADIHMGGTLAVATTAAQMERLRLGLTEDHNWGMGPEDLFELGPLATAERVRIVGALGSTFSPHCARIHPAKLVRGLAQAVERRGAVIYEHSPALALTEGRVTTASGTVSASWTVRATEGYTAGIPGHHRRLLPMNSSMIVTEPLAPETWAEIDWAGRETVRDASHAYVYMQRTADDRIAIGGRGIPYRFGSNLRRVGENPPSTVSALTSALGRLFGPRLADTTVAGAWSGVLGVARDWCPSVGVDRFGDGGLAWAGGYVGDGVTTSHLAGLTVADLVLGRSTPRTALPWVDHRSRLWEPEPFRWLGVHGIYALYRAADRAEARHPDRAATSSFARVADLISGRH